MAESNPTHVVCWEVYPFPDVFALDFTPVLTTCFPLEEGHIFVFNFFESAVAVNQVVDFDPPRPGYLIVPPEKPDVDPELLTDSFLLIATSWLRRGDLE